MNVRLNERDIRVGTIVAEHYGAPMDEVARLLATSIENAYRVTKRWRDAGLMSPIGVKPVPGYYWVYPTKSGAEKLLGWPVRYWQPRPMMAEHLVSVLHLRLALVGPELGRWVSERRLRYELLGPTTRGVRLPHIHDGRYTDDDGRTWALEVELTAKSPIAARDTVQRAYDAAKAAGCAGLSYYYRGEAVANVVRDAMQSVVKVDGCALFLTDLDAFLDECGIERRPDRSRRRLRLIAGGAADHDHAENGDTTDLAMGE